MSTTVSTPIAGAGAAHGPGAVTRAVEQALAGLQGARPSVVVAFPSPGPDLAADVALAVLNVTTQQPAGSGLQTGMRPKRGKRRQSLCLNLQVHELRRIVRQPAACVKIVAIGLHRLAIVFHRMLVIAELLICAPESDVGPRGARALGNGVEQ